MGCAVLPELARQCLLHADAMDLVDAEPGLSPRMEPTDGLRGERTVYQPYLDDIRGTAFHLLSLREYPLSTRMFMLAYLGKQTAGCSTARPARSTRASWPRSSTT